jgi:hypothetical protein
VADSAIGSLRRFYLLKRITAQQLDDLALSSVWHSKQLEQPEGSPLPASFPFKDKLETAGYVATADLEGADADELVQYAALTRSESEAVIAAFAAL